MSMRFKNEYRQGARPQGRRQKIFQGGQRKKRPKISKKGRKIALLILYLHVVPCLKIWERPRLSLPPAADTHEYRGI